MLAVLGEQATISATGLIAAESSSTEFLASRVAAAMRDGRAHVEPLFLSGAVLDRAREDIVNVLASTGSLHESDEFHSMKTDLLDPAFRQTIPEPFPFSNLLGQIDELREALAERTGRSFCDGGGLHLMYYPVGSKFMRHVDEDPSLYEPLRNSVSFLIYLTPDDWSEEDGGALLLYEDGPECQPRQVLPSGGTLVTYDSTLEHEVRPTRRKRHLISGRFREQDEAWQRSRRTRAEDWQRGGASA
jgi:hypothetical protein